MVTVHIFVQYNMPTVHYTNRTLEWSHTIPITTKTINPNDDTQNNQDSDRASTPVISNTSTSISLKNETRIEGVTELDDRTVQLSMRINTNECSNHSQQSSAQHLLLRQNKLKTLLIIMIMNFQSVQLIIRNNFHKLTFADDFVYEDN